MLNKEIKSRDRVKDFGEVFTPQWCVSDMLNLVPDILPERVQNTYKTDSVSLDYTVLEPSCGTGNILIEVLVRKLAIVGNSDIHNRVLKAVNSIYGVDIQPDNVLETRSRLKSKIQEFYKELNLDYQEVAETIDKILRENIVLGNMLINKCIYLLDYNGTDYSCLDKDGNPLTLGFTAISEYLSGDYKYIEFKTHMLIDERYNAGLSVVDAGQLRERPVKQLTNQGVSQEVFLSAISNVSIDISRPTAQNNTSEQKIVSNQSKSVKKPSFSGLLSSGSVEL